jgi:hypothetical protein
MAKIKKQLGSAFLAQNHVVETDVPCPMPGHEDALISTHTADGRPAWWADGNVYVRNEDLPAVRTWVDNLRDWLESDRV